MGSGNPDPRVCDPFHEVIFPGQGTPPASVPAGTVTSPPRASPMTSTHTAATPDAFPAMGAGMTGLIKNPG